MLSASHSPLVMGYVFEPTTLLSAPPGPERPYTDFSIFFRSETPSRIRSRPLGVVPLAGGVTGAELVIFAVSAWVQRGRSNMGVVAHVHVARVQPLQLEAAGQSLRQQPKL